MHGKEGKDGGDVKHWIHVHIDGEHGRDSEYDDVRRVVAERLRQESAHGNVVLCSHWVRD